MYIRKYYDAAPVDAGAAPPVEAPVVPPNVAEQMAKGGRKVEGLPNRQPQAPPVTAPKTEATPPAPPPAETAKTAPPVQEPPKSEVKSETPPKEEPAKPATPPAPTWQEALKKQDQKAVLRELGFDDKQIKLLETIKGDPKMAKFFDHWSSKGDVTAYLKAASTDYSKMAPEEVMRHSLREKYPEMSAEDFGELYKMRVLERYKLDGNEDYTEADLKRARIELTADAKDHRDSLVKQQQDYLLSVAPDQTPDTSAADAEAVGKQTAESYQKYMSEDSFVKDVINTKILKFGEGDEAFNYKVNPEELTNILYDPKEWAKAYFKSVPDENGNGEFIPDSRKQLIVAALVKDTDGFLKLYADHHQSIGANKAIAPIENASTPGAAPARTEAQPNNPAAAMAKGGRIVQPRD
jgi:hypothetical protein